MRGDGPDTIDTSRKTARQKRLYRIKRRYIEWKESGFTKDLPTILELSKRYNIDPSQILRDVEVVRANLGVFDGPKLSYGGKRYGQCRRS